MAEELEPFILYRLDGSQVECALWQIQDGPRALALFLTADNAVAYREANGLGAAWKIFRPGRSGLLELLKTSFRAGIETAVLDPDSVKAKRIFNIRDILTALGELADHA